ncbi:MAG: cell division protein FtsZ, partial [Paludibacter sp.]
MVFITAGMGGGTGTGASPIVAKAAHDMDILTVGIVTIPFAFEGKMKIRQALEGVAALSEHVDAILVINNEKLKEIYPDLELSNAFAKADDVLTNAAKAIAEIITVGGYINTDFADVYSILKDGNVAIMNTGFASGENRITKAIEDALNSPLLNSSDVSGASKILLSLYCSTTDQIRMEEVDQIHEFMSKVGENVQVIWGATFDDSLKENVKITLIATGFEVSDIPGMPASAANKVQENKPIHSVESAKIHQINTADDQPELELSIEEIEEEVKKAVTEKAMEQYYGKTTETEPEPEPELLTFTLDDFEDPATLKTVEAVPAWKRKIFK